MKSILALLIFSMTTAAFAQEEVYLNAKEVFVNSAEAVLVRTNQTPNKVKVNFTVPMSRSICERYETRQVPTTVQVRCGETVTTRRVYTGKVCKRRNPHNNECLSWADSYRNERVVTPRYCAQTRYYSETYCAQYGSTTSLESDSMEIRFEGLPALADSERELFAAKLTQEKFNDNTIIQNLNAVETLREYSVKKKKGFLGIGTSRDTFIVKEK